MSNSNGSMIFLVGAPECSSLDWEEEGLLSLPLSNFSGLLSGQYIGQGNNSTSRPPWRSIPLDSSNISTGIKEDKYPPEAVSRESHLDTSSSLSESSSSLSLRTQETPAIRQLSSAHYIQSLYSQSLHSSSLSASQSSFTLPPAFLRLPTSTTLTPISHILAAPPVRAPLTILAVLLTIQARSLPARAALPPLDLLTLSLGDDTHAPLRLTLFLPSRGGGRTVTSHAAKLCAAARAARVGDVLLVRDVVVGQYRGEIDVRGVKGRTMLRVIEAGVEVEVDMGNDTKRDMDGHGDREREIEVEGEREKKGERERERARTIAHEGRLQQVRDWAREFVARGRSFSELPEDTQRESVVE